MQNMQKKFKGKSWKTIGIILIISLLIPVIFIILGTTFFNFLDFQSDSGENSLKEVSSADCPNSSGKIKQYQYYLLGPTFLIKGASSKVFTYVDSRDIVFLQDNNGYTKFKNSLQDFEKKNSFVSNHVDKSREETFPVLDFMQKNFEFETFSPQIKLKTKAETSGLVYNSKYEKFYQNPPVLEATYINPDKIEKSKFEQIVNCLKETKMPIGITTLVYGKTQTQLDRPTQYNYLLNSIFLEMACADNGFLTIENNGAVRVSEYKEYTKDKYGVKESFYIGYFDNKSDFIRENKLENLFDLDKIKAEKVYLESPTLKLLFNDKGESINDYLKTCKNLEGKTVFDIFKN